MVAQQPGVGVGFVLMRRKYTRVQGRGEWKSKGGRVPVKAGASGEGTQAHRWFAVSFSWWPAASVAANPGGICLWHLFSTAQARHGSLAWLSLFAAALFAAALLPSCSAHRQSLGSAVELGASPQESLKVLQELRAWPMPSSSSSRHTSSSSGSFTPCAASRSCTGMWACVREHGGALGGALCKRPAACKACARLATRAQALPQHPAAALMELRMSRQHP